MTGFSERILALALSIPEGRVATYGDLARAAGGGALASRSVSSILSKYPNQGAIPWHRIVYANGNVWLDPKHETKRRALYKREGIEINDKGRILNFDEIRYEFQ